MLHFLDKLRNRPESERKAIVVVSSTVITGFIFLIWLSVSFYDLRSNTQTSVVADSTTSLKPAPSPFSDFKNVLGSAYASFLGQLGNLKTSVDSSVNTYQAQGVTGRAGDRTSAQKDQ